jgi:hypothetical protein
MYKFVILSVLLCVCETWSVILREECRFGMSETGVIRNTFGSKKDDVTGG